MWYGSGALLLRANNNNNKEKKKPTSEGLINTKHKGQGCTENCE